MRKIFYLTTLFLFSGNTLFAQQAFTIYNTGNSPLPDLTVRALAIDAQGRKWIGTDYGLAVFNDTTWEVYLTTNSTISDNSIRAIAFDMNGNAWIGTQLGGVNKFDGTTFTVYNTFNSGIASDYIRGVAVDSSNSVWICTDLGLSKFDGTWTTYDMSNSLIPANSLASIAVENNFTRYVGTVNGGFAVMADTAFTTYNAGNGFPDNSILAITIDAVGYKWMACPAGGLVRFYGTSFFSFDTFNSTIPDDSFDAIDVDSVQNIYLGSFNVGVVKKQGSGFLFYGTANSAMPDNIVYSIAVERTGIIWAGTSTQGVVRIDESLYVGDNRLEKFPAVVVYPNPAKNFVNINTGNNSLKKICITNMAGKKIIETVVNDASSFYRIDILKLQAGIYFLSVTTTTETFNSKIIKAE